MKQILIRAGSAVVDDIPAPKVSPGSLLVQVHASCISVGTEMASVRSSRTPLHQRALREPERVRQVMQMVRDEGLTRTVARVTGKLAAGNPTGYSAAGVVAEVGAGVKGFRVGDRVACAGAGIANHAEFISVPVNLAVRIPPEVSTRGASTVTLGAIAMQGVRRAAPTLGETVLVVGLGILGQLTVQMLAAAGCTVIGVDPDPERLAQAAGFGMDHGLDPAEADYVPRVFALTGGVGADAVIVTAAGASSEIISHAFGAARKKARVVLVGDVGLQLKRSDLYAKEIDFLISCSYGPGRYDASYEEGGQDYPIAYVRWTENRNMAAYLALVARGKIAVESMIDEVVPVEGGAAAFAKLEAKAQRPLCVILEYPQDAVPAPARRVEMSSISASKAAFGVAVIGAGSFLQGMHLPNIARLSDTFSLQAVMSRTGTTAKAVAQQRGARYATTDADEVLADPAVDVVVIGTRHNLHAGLVLRALEAGKHVLVEKPLALTEAGLADIEAFYAANPGGPILLTGFNRRFAPALAEARKALKSRAAPLIISYRMNAGRIPIDHWTQGPEGGGRNIGEACHIYDLFLSLTGAAPEQVAAQAVGVERGHWQAQDNFAATIRFDDGSLAELIYTALGAPEHPKEQMEIFAGGTVLSLNDYRSLSSTGAARASWSGGADKGHFAMLKAFAAGLRTGVWPIPLADQLAATRMSFAVEAQINPAAAWADEAA
jgi:predicted dehydrogenase/threonine dehydrogenase-like Zn-dependent dehydrogenase